MINFMLNFVIYTSCVAKPGKCITVLVWPGAEVFLSLSPPEPTHFCDLSYLSSNVFFVPLVVNFSLDQHIFASPHTVICVSLVQRLTFSHLSGIILSHLISIVIFYQIKDICSFPNFCKKFPNCLESARLYLLVVYVILNVPPGIRGYSARI